MECMTTALQSWDGIRLGLMALGYRRVLWVHIHCLEHGLFRCGEPEELEFYPCPTCQQACKASILAEGFTRRNLPFAPELIVAPLSSQARQQLLANPRIVKPRRLADRHARKARRVPSEHQSACDARPRASVVRCWAMPDR